MTIAANDPTATEGGPTTGQFTVTLRQHREFANRLFLGRRVGDVRLRLQFYWNLRGNIAGPEYGDHHSHAR